MPLVQINAGQDGLKLHKARHSFIPILRKALCTPGPIIIMVHGFKFSPGHAYACPHENILTLNPKRSGWKVKSWPKALGFGIRRRDEGVAIAFGWNGRGSIWQAYREAGSAAEQLSRLLRVLAHLAPERPVHFLAHSLGARVVLNAISNVQHPTLGRAILLNPAEFCEVARERLETSNGRQLQLINVTSRENDIFDLLLETFFAKCGETDRPRCLGRGLFGLSNCLTLQIDNPDVVNALAKSGYMLGNKQSLICHWSTYLRDGVFEFYNDILRRPHELTLPDMRRTLAHTQDPRWSKLINRARRKVEFTIQAGFAEFVSSLGSTRSTTNQ
ncbi:MAG: alpha/beta hydrolase [Pseudomonadota bacterium]